MLLQTAIMLVPSNHHAAANTVMLLQAPSRCCKQSCCCRQRCCAACVENRCRDEDDQCLTAVCGSDRTLILGLSPPLTPCMGRVSTIPLREIEHRHLTPSPEAALSPSGASMASCMYPGPHTAPRCTSTGQMLLQVVPLRFTTLAQNLRMAQTGHLRVFCLSAWPWNRWTASCKACEKVTPPQSSTNTSFLQTSP